MFSWRLGPGHDCDLDRADRVPPRFKRLITAHEHLLAVLLKLCQRMGYFPTLEDVPEQVVAKRRGSVGGRKGFGPSRCPVPDHTRARGRGRERRHAPQPSQRGRMRRGGPVCAVGRRTTDRTTTRGGPDRSGPPPGVSVVGCQGVPRYVVAWTSCRCMRMSWALPNAAVYSTGSGHPAPMFQVPRSLSSHSRTGSGALRMSRM